MIETRRLKSVVIFFQTILSFVLSRKIINVYNDLARKYVNVTVKDFRKYEKLEYKKNKLELDLIFRTIANNLVYNQNSLSLNWRMFQIKMLHQFIKKTPS